jgi:branched-chain amino acid transport system substrate-binding protein
MPKRKRLGGVGSSKTNVGRRDFLKKSCLVGLAAAASSIPSFNIAKAASRTIKIGYMHDKSGNLANWSETADFTIGKIKQAIKDGLAIGGKTYPVEIVVKDGQSDRNQASVIASELVLREKCDLILAASGGNMIAIGPLADARGVPAISSCAPWESFIVGRNAKPGPDYKGFPFHFHFFWGVGSLMDNFVGIWNTAQTNKTVGSIWLDNAAGRAFSDPVRGLPASMKKGGYKEVPAGFFQPTNEIFTNQISAFKNAGCEIVTGMMYASQWAILWNQALQAGYKPKIASIAQAFMFPSDINALGDAGDGMSAEVIWTPAFPYKSSVTGHTAREWADEWEKSTGRQWTQPMGYLHALWEVGLAALKNAADPKDKNAIRDAIKNLNMETIVGQVNFKGSGIPNVAVTFTLGGQWRKTKGGKFKYDLIVVSNSGAPNFPVQDKLKLLTEL